MPISHKPVHIFRDCAVSPVIGFCLMLVVSIIIAVIVSGYAGSLGVIRTQPPYEVNMTFAENNQIFVFTYNPTTGNVINGSNFSIYEHGEPNLLEGPVSPDVNGGAIFNPPNGYEVYDIVVYNENFKVTKTVDNRSWFGKLDDYLGTSGNTLLTILVTFFVGLLSGHFLTKRELEKK